jgi:hypothetical protein
VPASVSVSESFTLTQHGNDKGTFGNDKGTFVQKLPDVALVSMAPRPSLSSSDRAKEGTFPFPVL